MQKSILTVVLIFCAFAPSFSQTKKNAAFDPFLDTLEQRTFKYFWECVDPKTGLSPDRYPTKAFSSITAIGYSLTAYGIGAERNYVTRAQAADRVKTTLKYLWNLPQGTSSMNDAGYRGFYYHFLKYETGTRFAPDVDLSSIDTAWLMLGILFAQSYFDRNNDVEKEIRSLADSLYRRVEWNWMQPRSPLITMGWYPEKGYHKLDYGWNGFDEASGLYFLAIGSPTHAIDPAAWKEYSERFQWVKKYGYEYIDFDVLFWNQFTECWYDMRGIQDQCVKEKGIDYFENARRSTYANRAYCIENPKKNKGYSGLFWGISASDGPPDGKKVIDGVEKQFVSYGARGCSKNYWFDDGTITPYAAGGSLPMAPEICLPTLKAIREQIPGMWTEYGFKDAFNQSYVTEQTPNGWVDKDYLGLDQGPIIIMIENYRNGLVWETMKKNPYIVNGLKRAGFTGGWLDKKK